MTSLNKLGQNRDEILKAEIGVLLFNLGKTHIGFSFWRDYFPHKTSEFKFSSYKDYPKSYLYNELEEISPQLKRFFKDLEINLDLLKINIIELIKGGESEENFIKQVFFRGCENINSGIDKGNPKAQLKGKLWIANAFGTYKKEVKESDLDLRRQCFFKNLSDFLNQNNYLKYPNWKDIRDFIIKEIKSWYSKLLSDSRFPVNDVTLWDQAYMTASLFKATLAQLIAENTNDLDSHDYFKNPSSIKWRILGIQYDKMGLAEKGFKLASIRWYRNISRKIDDAIKELIEVEYPVGNEIYRDETGIYFIVGECLGNDSEENSIVPLKQEFKELEDRILEVFKKKTNDEFYPAIYLTKASRGLMNLTTLLEKAKENFLKINWKVKNLDIDLQKTYKSIGICPICKIRLIYESDKEKQNSPTICETCDDRIHHKQVENWIRNISEETIWLEEIKDESGRISCISFHLLINPWIINTLITRKTKESYLDIIEDTINLLSKPNSKIKDGKIKNYIWGIPGGLDTRQFINSWLIERLIEYKWEKFFKSKLSNQNFVDFKSRKIKWDQLNYDDLQFISEVTVQFLLRKNPSPARIRRIWETTKGFLKDIHNDLENILEIPEWRKKRLVWEVKNEIKTKIKTSGEEVESNGLKFWAQPDGEYIKVYLISSIYDFLDKYDKIQNNNQEKKILKEILNRVNVNLEDVKKFLKGINFKLKLKKLDKESAGITINSENLIEVQSYKPFSLITDISPVNYQVIIPAEYVPKFIDKVIEEYDRNFKYVYGKLPLHIGIITSHYKKPLYVSLKALRRIRRGNINTDKLWQKKDVNEFCQLQKKKLKHATSEELVNKTEEYYSLYFDNPDRKEYQFYIKPDENWKKWISTISEFPLNSQVEIIPNTFDFEFMDTNTRRNDIFYDEKNHYKRALPLKSNRPYELEIYWPKFKEFYEIFKDKNKSAKLHRLIELLYEKAQNYNEAFKPLLASAFVNILELRKDNETLERIQRIFDLNTELDILKALEEKLTEENLKLFIDMFEFWHTAFKGV